MRPSPASDPGASPGTRQNRARSAERWRDCAPEHQKNGCGRNAPRAPCHLRPDKCSPVEEKSARRERAEPGPLRPLASARPRFGIGFSNTRRSRASRLGRWRRSGPGDMENSPAAGPARSPSRTRRATRRRRWMPLGRGHTDPRPRALLRRKRRAAAGQYVSTGTCGGLFQDFGRALQHSLLQRNRKMLGAAIAQHVPEGAGPPATRTACAPPGPALVPIRDG